MLTPVVRTESLVRRTDLRLRPDPARVVNRLFIAGEELSHGNSRANPVMQRVLAMSELEAETLLADTLVRFEDRHPDLDDDLMEHFNEIGDRLGAGDDLSPARQMLLGAYATNEYSVEAAALCNPSIVAHPDQRGLGEGELRFVLSLRAVGEGHISSIEFRTGILGPEGSCTVDDPGPLLFSGQCAPSEHVRESFRALVQVAGSGDEIVTMVFDRLPPTFTGAELDASLAGLHPQVQTRRKGREIIERIRTVARSNYTVVFPPSSEIGQRVLQPIGPTESRGMEDARFVLFTDDDGTSTYYATYTAFDGTQIAPQLLRTDDFGTFHISQLSGRAATNKGMALFPRKIDGRFVALSRWDRETNAVSTSLDATSWDDPVELQSPEQPWELIQVGNCGSPIETPEGWLVLTHGVGPMRTYSLGAMLLDLADPTVIRGKLASPLLSPDEDERDGYVPNVVYSCGALVHGDTVVLPYAYGDRQTTLGLISLPDLLDRLLAR